VCLSAKSLPNYSTRLLCTHLLSHIPWLLPFIKLLFLSLHKLHFTFINCTTHILKWTTSKHQWIIALSSLWCGTYFITAQGSDWNLEVGKQFDLGASMVSSDAHSTWIENPVLWRHLQSHTVVTTAYNKMSMTELNQNFSYWYEWW
jgi:hypothetical protein